MVKRYDVVVIGAGPAGENAAGGCAAKGLSTALVESELVGGECSYWACIPSKSLLRPAVALAAAQRVPAVAAAVTGTLDVAAALSTRDHNVAFYDDTAQADWVRGAGIDLFRGRGRLDGERRVVVQTPDGNQETLEAAKAVVLATGSSAVMPPIPGLDTVGAWDSRAATSAKAVPRRLAVIGGGVVAVEMAQAWHSLGSQEVTVLVRGDQLLAREEPFAGRELLAAFGELGIDVRQNVEVFSVERTTRGVYLHLHDGSTVTADEVLVATGRRPNTHDLGMATVGLEAGKLAEVNDRLLVQGVSGEWLYAVGDVNGRNLLTHMGKYQARQLAEILGGKNEVVGKDVAVACPTWADHRAVPRVVFTDPQVAAVGLTMAQAQHQGLEVRELKVPLASAAGTSLLGNDINGTAQLVVDQQRNIIVGATFTGPEVGEMLHAATIAIVGDVTLDRLWHAVPAFPTVSEVWLRLLEAL